MIIDIDSQFKNLNTNGLNINYSKVSSCVKNIIKNKGYVNYNVDVQVFVTEGGNYLGVLCEVNIKNQNDKELNVFIKIITPGEHMTLLCLPEAYRKEQYVYHELSKIFLQMQNEVNIPNEDKYKFVHSYDESTEDVIILDNMSKKGYKTWYRMDTITLQFAELAIKNLAKFHALSFALEAKRQKYFDELIKPLKQPLNFNDDWKGFLMNMSQISLDVLEGERRSKLENAIPSFVEKYMKYNNSKCGNDVLCHGDYRTNNILFKEVNGTITDLIPIDFQLIYHGCPVIDFFYFIFPATDREFRRSHLNYLKDLYHETLGTFLEYFNLDVKEVYPREDFEAQYKERLLYGLMISVNILPFLLAKNDDTDITKGELAGLSINVDSKLKDRVGGLVDDFVEWGYL